MKHIALLTKNIAPLQNYMCYALQQILRHSNVVVPVIVHDRELFSDHVYKNEMEGSPSSSSSLIPTSGSWQTLAHTSSSAPHRHISEQLSCWDLQEQWDLPLVFLHPHLIRCVMVAGAGGSLVTGTSRSTSAFQPCSLAGGSCGTGTWCWSVSLHSWWYRRIARTNTSVSGDWMQSSVAPLQTAS